MSNLWNPYLLCVFLGAIFGFIGSVLSWKSPDIFDWKAAVLALTALASWLLAPYATVFPFVAVAAISTLAGWIACLLLEESMSRVVFEHAVLKGQFDVIVRPLIVSGLLWLVWRVLAFLVEHSSIIKVQITINSSVAPWLVSLVIAIWVASIFALPRAYLNVRSEVMYKRSRRV